MDAGGYPKVNKPMSQSVYEERRSATASASMKPFVDALLPLLNAYGLLDVHPQFDHLHSCLIGNQDSPHLEYVYDVSEGNMWQSHETRQTLKSHQLVHTATGETISLFIDIHDVEWAGTTLELRFEGTAEEIEKLKKAVQEAREGCTW